MSIPLSMAQYCINCKYFTPFNDCSLNSPDFNLQVPNKCLSYIWKRREKQTSQNFNTFSSLIGKFSEEFYKLPRDLRGLFSNKYYKCCTQEMLIFSLPENIKVKRDFLEKYNDRIVCTTDYTFILHYKWYWICTKKGVNANKINSIKSLPKNNAIFINLLNIVTKSSKNYIENKLKRLNSSCSLILATDNYNTYLIIRPLITSFKVKFFNAFIKNEFNKVIWEGEDYYTFITKPLECLGLKPISALFVLT